MDPVYAAWTAAGKLVPADISRSPGHCARCSAAGPIVATSRVVTSDFSGFDNWNRAAAGGLCAACTWSYRHASLRMHPHLVRRSPQHLSALTLPQLRDQLRQPLPAGLAIAVPLRAGRASGQGRVMRWEVHPSERDLWTAAHLHPNGDLGRPTPEACLTGQSHSRTGGLGTAGLRPPYVHPEWQRWLHLPVTL